MKLIFIFIFMYIEILAHPHVFLESFTQPEITKEYIKGINFTIIMDEMNSLIFIQTYDINKDNLLDKKEFIKLANENFSGIIGKKSHFHIRYGNKNINLKSFKLNEVFMDEGNLIYKIFIPLNIKIEKEKNLYIGIYDSDYYYDYDYCEEYFLKDKINRNFKLSFGENYKISYYMGNLNPLEYEVIFWKKQ